MTVLPAVGALTGHRSEDLSRWLRELHKVAALTGQAALDALDAFLWAYGEWRGSEGGNAVPGAATGQQEALDDAAWATWQCAEDVSRLRETIVRLRRQQEAGQVDVWEPQTLRRQAANVGHFAGPDARTSMAADIAGVQAEAEALALELDTAIHRQAIRTAGEKVITNSNTLLGIAGTVDRSIAALVQLGAVTEADREAGKAAKLRAAHWRCDKRLGEAEVAAAGGAVGKAEKMRAEAAVMLRQDMAKAGLDTPPADEPPGQGTSGP